MRAWAVLVCLAAGAQAFVVQPPARLPCTRCAAPRVAAPSMLLTELPLDVAAASVSASLPSTVLVSEVFDSLQGFAGSPAILLLPIGVGSLVAAGIIFVLVKSAG